MEDRKAIFIDKDGTLIPNIPYNVDPEKITLSANSLNGLVKLQKMGYLFVLITNQSGVARGLFKEQDLEAVKSKIEALFSKEGIQLSGFYYCPHHPQGSVHEFAKRCNCRKPANGLFLQAAKDLSINLSESWMIGDILNDVEAGNRAGCKSILLNNGNETEWKGGYFRKPTFIANDIDQAADFIINSSIYGKFSKQNVSVTHRQVQI